jgi:hypothetical protein
MAWFRLPWKFWLVGVLGGLLLTGCAFPPDTYNGPPHHDSKSIELGKTEYTRADIRMSAGELRVEGGSPKLVEADFSYGADAWRPAVHYSATGSHGLLSIEQPGGVPASNNEYRWDLRFNSDQPLDLSTHFGAGEARMNLGSLNLKSLEINMGVGQLDLDLRGNPKRDYDVSVHGGVGEATIHLPKTVGIKATVHGGIGDIDVRGLEKRGDRWVNPDHEDAPVAIHLEVSGGVGQIRLIAE